VLSCATSRSTFWANGWPRSASRPRQPSKNEKVVHANDGPHAKAARVKSGQPTRATPCPLKQHVPRHIRQPGGNIGLQKSLGHTIQGPHGAPASQSQPLETNDKSRDLVAGVAPAVVVTVHGHDAAAGQNDLVDLAYAPEPGSETLAHHPLAFRPGLPGLAPPLRGLPPWRAARYSADGESVKGRNDTCAGMAAMNGRSSWKIASVKSASTARTSGGFKLAGAANDGRFPSRRSGDSRPSLFAGHFPVGQICENPG